MYLFYYFFFSFSWISPITSHFKYILYIYQKKKYWLQNHVFHYLRVCSFETNLAGFKLKITKSFKNYFHDFFRVEKLVETIPNFNKIV